MLHQSESSSYLELMDIHTSWTVLVGGRPLGPWDLIHPVWGYNLREHGSDAAGALE